MSIAKPYHFVFAWSGFLNANEEVKCSYVNDILGICVQSSS